MSDVNYYVGRVREELEDSGYVRARVLMVTLSKDRKGRQFYWLDYNVDFDIKSKVQQFICNLIMAARISGRLDHVAFLSEAWTSSVKPGEKRKYARCEDDPDRGENVFVIHFTAAGTRTVKSFDIDRSSGRSTLGQEQPRGGWELLSMWIDKGFVALPPPPIPPEIVEQAHKYLDEIGGRFKRPTDSHKNN